MNQRVVECRRLYENFDIQVFPLHFARSIADIGTFRPGKLVLFFQYALRLVGVLRQFRPDLVYFVPAVTGFSFYRDFLLALLVKVFPCRLIYHLHGKGIAKRAANPFIRALYTAFFRNAYVIHLSEQLFADIAAVADHSMCWFLPNGIDYDAKELSAFEKQSGRNVPVILYLSNLVPSKGPMVLLESCRLLKNRRLDFKAHFVGNPSNEISKDFFLNEVRSKGLEYHVRYLGPKYGSEKARALVSADILAFPTHRDCFPLVLLEAMASRLPVVATNEGAISEIIDDGQSGYLVEKDNPEHLADKLEYLIRNPTQAVEMGRRGFTKFKSEYTLDRFYDNLIDILVSWAAEQPSRLGHY